MSRIRRPCTVLISSLAMAAALPAAAEAPKEDAAYYSTMCHSTNSGDLNGQRIALLNYFGAHFVIFQDTIGVLIPPVTAKAKVVGDSLDFDLPPDNARSRSFTGTVMPQEIVGTFTYSIPGKAPWTVEARFPRKGEDYMVLPPCGGTKP